MSAVDHEKLLSVTESFQKKMATIIDGVAIAAEVIGDLKKQLESIREAHPDFTPGLAIVQVKKLSFLLKVSLLDIT